MGESVKTGGSLSGCCPSGLLMVLPPLPPPLVTGEWCQTGREGCVCGRHQGGAQHQRVGWAGWLGYFLGTDLVTFTHKPASPGHPHSDALSSLGTCLKCIFQVSPEIPVQWSGVGPRHQYLTMFSRCV